MDACWQLFYGSDFDLVDKVFDHNLYHRHQHAVWSANQYQPHPQWSTADLDPPAAMAADDSTSPDFMDVGFLPVRSAATSTPPSYSNHVQNDHLTKSSMTPPTCFNLEIRPSAAGPFSRQSSPSPPSPPPHPSRGRSSSSSSSSWSSSPPPALPATSSNMSHGLPPHRKRYLNTYCVFCKNNKETLSFYASHVLKDEDGNVSCPVLRAYQCPICNAKGDRAHTIKYCPLRKNTAPAQQTAQGSGALGSSGSGSMASSPDGGSASASGSPVLWSWPAPVGTPPADGRR